MLIHVFWIGVGLVLPITLLTLVVSLSGELKARRN
jgi:hypothetical protein